MPELSDITLFLAASFVLIIAPGPDILFLITQSVNHGVKAGLATALGLASGNLVHTLAAALGASVLFQTSQVAFNGLKIAGVCYLLYLAWEAITKSNLTNSDEPQATQTQSSLFVRGVLMNMLNPKVALFFLAFLPQFVNPQGSPVWMQMIFYGVVFTAMVILIFGSIGLFAGSAQNLLMNNPHRQRRFRWITATVFIFLALRLLLIEQ